MITLMCFSLSRSLCDFGFFVIALHLDHYEKISRKKDYENVVAFDFD